MHKYLSLDQCLVSFDLDSNVFRITSKDPKLKGKPFQITLPVSSKQESYTVNTLFELMLERGDEVVEGVRLPSSIDFPDKKKWEEIYEKILPKRYLDTSDLYKEVLPMVGETFGGEEILFNLTVPGNGRLANPAPNTLISGMAGGGKTHLLKVIAKNASYSGVKAVVLSPKGSFVEEFDDIENSDVKVSDGLMNSYSELVTISDLINDRSQVVEDQDGVSRFRWQDDTTEMDLYEDKPIYLLIDEVAELLHTDVTWFTDAVISKLSHILTAGTMAGVYVFMASQRFDFTTTSLNDLWRSAGRRVIVGGSAGVDSERFLGVDGGMTRLDEDLLSRGVAISSVRGETPTLFRVYGEY